MAYSQLEEINKIIYDPIMKELKLSDLIFGPEDSDDDETDYIEMKTLLLDMDEKKELDRIIREIEEKEENEEKEEKEEEQEQ